MDSYFSLIDETLFLFENKLDRIFYCDDMSFEIGIYIFDHRCEIG